MFTLGARETKQSLIISRVDLVPRILMEPLKQGEGEKFHFVSNEPSWFTIPTLSPTYVAVYSAFYGLTGPDNAGTCRWPELEERIDPGQGPNAILKQGYRRGSKSMQRRMNKLGRMVK